LHGKSGGLGKFRKCRSRIHEADLSEARLTGGWPSVVQEGVSDAPTQDSLTSATKNGETLTHVTRVRISMVSLKWGDILSTLLPGAVALVALSPFFPTLARQIDHPKEIGPAAGVALLMAAALAGGILEAWTRVTWEKYWLAWRCPSPDVLSHLNEKNQELYERGVESSYKYAIFYANLAWAILLLLARRAVDQQFLVAGSLILACAIALLLRASHVQWTYYVNYLNKVFASKA
jgi:hypothetical protein